MSNTLKKPTLEDAKNKWLKLPISTNESAYSIYSKEQDKYISILENNLYKLSKAHLALQIKYEELKQKK